MAAGDVKSSQSSFTDAGTVLNLSVTKDGSSNQVVLVLVGAYDAPATGILPSVTVEGAAATMIHRSDANTPGGSPTELRQSAWLYNVTGSGAAAVVITYGLSTYLVGSAHVIEGVNQGLASALAAYGDAGALFNAGPLASSATGTSVSAEKAFGYGVVSFGATVTAVGGGETQIGAANGGSGSINSDLYHVACSKASAVGSVAFSDTTSGSGRWRHSTLVLRLVTDSAFDEPGVAPHPIWSTRNPVCVW